MLSNLSRSHNACFFFSHLQLESLLAQQGDATTATTIISIVKSLCQRGVIYGTLSISSSSAVASQKAPLTNAIYTPDIYSRSQRKLVDSFYQNNGYLTEKKCAALGLSRSRMEKFVKESFVSYVVCIDSPLNS